MRIWTRTGSLVSTLLVIFVGCVGSIGSAQEPAQTTSGEALSSSQVTVEQVERALAELEHSTEVAADIKLQAVENYRAALKNLQSAADSDARLMALISETETVPARAQQLKNQRAELIDKKPSIEPGLSLQELEQLLPTTELKLSGHKKARLDAEADLQSRSLRRKEIRARMTVIQEKVADALLQLKTLASAEPNQQNQSLTSRLLTRRLALDKEKPSLESELSRFDAEEAADLVRLRIEVSTCNATYAEKLIGMLQQRINSAREAAAEESVRMARREAISADPALKIYAEQNQKLAENAKVLTEALANTESERKASAEVLEGLARQFAQTKKKVDSVGLTSAVGALLRKQMATLPDFESRRVSVADRQKLINNTQYQLFEYEEAYQELAEIDSTIERIVAEAKRDSSKNVALLESAARDLMQRKRECLDVLARSTGQYFDTLIELDTVDQQVIALVAEYKNYIEERVLWIRSGSALTAGVHVEASDAWMLSPGKWKESLVLLARDSKRNVILYAICLVLIGIFLFRRRTIRNAITTVGAAAERVACCSIGPTLRGLWLTSIVALVWPMICLFVGWRLGQCAGESEFTAAVGQGLKVVGVLGAFLEWVRLACCKKGICEAHFSWPPHITSAIRRKIKLYIVIVLPIAFVTATLAASDGIQERGEIQRVAFILGMCVMGFGVFRLLRPAGAIQEYLATNHSGFIARIGYLFPLFGVALPLSLSALAASGYYYTAQTLFWRLIVTCIFVASLIVVRAVLYRMLLLRQRHLRIEETRQRAAAAKLAGDGVGDVQPVAGIVTENEQADISAHIKQSRNLVSTAMTAITLVGLWMIWIQALPVLDNIGNYPLWGKAEAVAVANATQPPMSPMAMSNASSTGETTPSVTATDGVQSGSVTVSILALAILIAFVTVVLFRNGPGLLEVSILQQLTIEASVRYAITTLVSYVIVMAGTIATCSTIGLQWSQIQWLATALTFGLAFGLQEMFANFVAGLIILLERPIRVGDTVTVDDITGVVSRIRIRATSITNWDRKEYVVPNKEFITGRLLNWTLSDKVNRIVVEVGLAYGSDTERARELLLQTANDHLMVLKDPPAKATFQGFGDNSLNLALRAFLPTLENRLQVIHELHTAIDRAFRKANIEIAFPQRDLHIRSISGAEGLGISANDDNADGYNDELRDVA